MASPGDRDLQAERQILRLPIRDVDVYRQGNERFDQQYVNCFPELHKEPLTGEGHYILQKRPGMTNGHDFYTVSGAASRAYLQGMAITTVTQLTNQFVVAIWNSNTGAIYIIGLNGISGHVLIGTISGGASIDSIHITECSIVNAGALYPGITVVWTKYDRSVSKCYSARSAGGVFTAASLTQITDVDFPDQLGTPKICTGPMIQLNGIFYVMTTDGWIYNSDNTALLENDPTAWTSGGKIQVRMQPDGGIGVYRYKHHIVAVGMNSIEFFNDMGNPPSGPRIGPTEQAYINFGALSSQSVLPVDDTLYWVSNSTSGTVGVWKLEGYTPVKISTSREDRDIRQSTSTNVYINDYSLFFLLINGKKHVGLNGILRNTPVRAFNYLNPGQQYIGNTGDTYKTSQVSNSRSSMIVYSIDEKIWWDFMHMSSGSNLSTTKIFSATKYNSTTATAYGDVIMILGGLNGTLYGSGSRSYQFDTGYTGTYADASTDTGVDGCAIAAMITFTPIEFNQMVRKRVAKAQLVFSDVPNRVSTGGDSANVYSMSLIYAKKNRLPYETTTATEGQWFERPLTYAVGQDRFYWNNLGMSRYWGFTIYACNKDPFSLKALELTVLGGTH